VWNRNHDAEQRPAFARVARNDKKITYDDFYNIKYDIKYLKDCHITKMLDKLFKAPPHPDDPLVQEGLALLKTFDYEADLDNRVMPLWY